MALEHWQPEPEDHDFPAAESYLGLLMPQFAATAVANTLKTAPTVIYKAKDLLRASDLTLLKKSNVHVAADLTKIREGHLLSPVLLVRGNVRNGFPPHDRGRISPDLRELLGRRER